MSYMTLAVIKNQEPVVIDKDRVFYYAGGGFKHTWDRWEVIQDNNGNRVRVYWGSNYVELNGSDAYNFLTIVKSKFASLFKRPNQA